MSEVSKLNFLSPLKEGLFRHAGKDALASIVVFLVALPLCMGVAIASGVPPALGLVTGIVGGIVVGMLSGSPMLVSGPAAGMTVLVWELVQEHGLGMLGPIVLLAGLVQVAAGLLRVGQWFRAISPAVVHGMLAGIGVLIIAGQIHVAVDDKPRGSGLDNLLAIPEAIWKGLMPLDGSTHHLAAAIGLLTLVVLVAWPRMPAKLRLVPGPLVAVVVATVATRLLNLPIKTVAVPSDLSSVVTLPTWATLGHLVDGPVLATAVAIAIIASAETLLSATAVDGMHQGPRTRYDKELLAQGVGNSLCGVLGALPMTGVIVRSSVNVTAGAKTRMSTIMHGTWLLLFITTLPWLLNWIPTAALAAMLVYTGFKLVEVKVLRKLSAYGNTEVAIYVITVVAIVSTNLLEGVLIGLAASVLKLLYSFSQLQTRLEVSPDYREAVLELEGAASFVRLPQLAKALERVPAGAMLHLRLDKLSFIDHACLELLQNWGNQQVATGGRLVADWTTLENKYHQRRPSAKKDKEKAMEKAAVQPTPAGLQTPAHGGH